MKFIFPILAILACAAAAFFSLTESEKFESVQKARLEDIATNKAVTAKADAADTKILEEKSILATAKDNLALVTQSVSALTSDSATLKRDATKVDDELATQEGEIVELNKTLEEVNKIIVSLDGDDVDIDTLPDKIVEIEEDIKTKGIKVEELDTLIGASEVTLASKQKAVSSLVKRKIARSERISRNAMTARVTAVNQDWGFLVIGAGSNSGVTPQTTLLVTRDGRLIGKVNPSSIEPTQTVAEIDLKSLAPGVRIQSGDQVILAKPAGN